MNSEEDIGDPATDGKKLRETVEGTREDGRGIAGRGQGVRLSMECVHCLREPCVCVDEQGAGCSAPVACAIPDEYAGRAMEESMRKDIVFGLSGGNLKRLRYSESLFPEWSAEKRKQLRLELLGPDYPANVAVSGPAVAGTLHRPCSTIGGKP